MKRTHYALVLAFMLIGCSTSYADVYYATPPTVYVRPDPSYQMGQTIGNLLGAMIAGANQRAEQEARVEREREILQQIQSNIDNFVRSEATSLGAAISEYGPQPIWDYLINQVYSSGFTPYTNVSNGIATLEYSKHYNDGSQMIYEYSINTLSQQCRSVVTISPIGMQASSTSSYTPPQRQTSEIIGEYLGIVVSLEKTKEGGFMVLEVVPNSLSDFAGIQKGDVVTKIDTYSLQEHDIERIASYINLRREHKATIKATVLRDGQAKIIEMQL
jgi:hypothetical protein